MSVATQQFYFRQIRFIIRRFKIAFHRVKFCLNLFLPHTEQIRHRFIKRQDFIRAEKTLVVIRSKRSQTQHARIFTRKAERL